MTTVEEFAAGFEDDPGYLDFASVGPPSRAVLVESQGQEEILARARFGSLDHLKAQDQRVREAVSAVAGIPADRVVFQPNTSSGLMQVMFGLKGSVLLAPSEFPSVTYAAVRSADALGALEPVWLTTDHGRVTPGQIRDQLTNSTTAVAVSLVDFRTGFVADLEGIRQVIGDRLLIVDAIQGFGVIDAPYEVADIVVSGGQKWVRAGWGTGFLALSDRALELVAPVLSGFSGSELDEAWTTQEVVSPAAGVRAFTISNPDCIAQARFAAALEQIADVGVPAINAAVAERVGRLLEIVDEFGLQVDSPRQADERAGIVVVTPRPDFLSHLTASLFNHGVTATTREGSVRLSAHVSTNDETFEMLSAALTMFTAASVP